MKKGSFTIEAAYIVPLMMVFIAYLLGFIYLTHQQNWVRGAAYESIYYALQTTPESIPHEERAGQRLLDRLSEKPMDLSEISSEVSEHTGTITAKADTSILPEIFGEVFHTEQRASAVILEPSVMKRAEWLLKYMKGILE